MSSNTGFKTLITARFDRDALASINDRIEEPVYSGFGVSSRKLDEDELIEALQGIDILISEFEPVSARVIAAAASLKIIGCCRTGPEASVDVEAATERSIPVLYTPGRNAVSVAEFTVALMISAARRLAEVYHLLKYTDELTGVSYGDKAGDRKGVTSEWSLDPEAPFNRFQGPELAGKVVGLVGYGAVGRAIAERLKGFRMRIRIFDPYVTDAQARAEGVENVSLEQLAETADFVVMAAKVTEETHGLFSAAMFDRMKPTAYFINTARAALVDYDALLRALSGGGIAGAALDVYPEEPIPSDSPLRSLPNAVLTPHLAGASIDIPRHHSRIIVEGIRQALSGERPTIIKNPEAWERCYLAGRP